MEIDSYGIAGKRVNGGRWRGCAGKSGVSQVSIMLCTSWGNLALAVLNSLAGTSEVGLSSQPVYVSTSLWMRQGALIVRHYWCRCEGRDR